MARNPWMARLRGLLIVLALVAWLLLMMQLAADATPPDGHGPPRPPTSEPAYVFVPAGGC